MSRLNVWTLVLALCVISPMAQPQEFRGRVIFSVEELEWSQDRNADGSTGPRKRTGIFYYYDEGRPGKISSTITGYKLREGEIVDSVGGGSTASLELLKKLNALSISSFNVEKELESMRVAAMRGGKGIPSIIVADGAKYRIRYDLNGVSIDYTGWNPGPFITLYAPYNENLRKLDELIDLFAAYYGRGKFRL